MLLLGLSKVTRISALAHDRDNAAKEVEKSPFGWGHLCAANRETAEESIRTAMETGWALAKAWSGLRGCRREGNSLGFLVRRSTDSGRIVSPVNPAWRVFSTKLLVSTNGLSIDPEGI